MFDKFIMERKQLTKMTKKKNRGKQQEKRKVQRKVEVRKGSNEDKCE